MSPCFLSPVLALICIFANCHFVGGNWAVYRPKFDKGNWSSSTVPFNHHYHQLYQCHTHVHHLIGRRDLDQPILLDFT
jgi:hypothetical protein